MKPSIVIAALLLASFRWSSGSNRVEVAPGEDAVLTCRNVSGKPVDMFWARLISGNYSCVASNTQRFCSGIRKQERFETSSNKSSVSLKVKDVKVDDSGFYFCVFDVFQTGEIELVQLNVTDLNSRADNSTSVPNGNSNCKSYRWISVALGVLSVLLMAIVGLAFKVKKLPKVQSQEHNGPSENLNSDNLNYASVNFQPKARRTRKAFNNEPNVIYAATR